MSGAAPRPAAAYRHWKSITLNWADNDVYGHVNNAVHYRWFDTAINEWLLDAGLLAFEGDEPIGLVVETTCRYLASLSFPGCADVGIGILSIGRSSIRFAVGIFHRDICVAEGQFVHVYVDRASRRPTSLPERWREILAGLNIEGWV